MTSTKTGLLLAGITLAIVGCESAPQQDEVWSSKSNSVYEPGVARLNAVNDRPILTDTVEMHSAAVDLLLEAARADHPLYRANAIEALQSVPEHLDEVLPEALADENHAVRFVAAMTVGELAMSEHVHLVEPLRHDEASSVRAAAIYAVRRCGRNADMTPLAEMITSPYPEIRGNAALVLGKLGNDSAIPMLRDALKTPMRATPIQVRIVDIQIAEAIARLGDARELDTIRAALFSPGEQAEISALAAQTLGRLHDSVYASTLEEMALREDQRREPAEVRMAAVWALAQMNPARAPMEVAIGFLNHDMPSLRAQAALTLGESGDPDRMIAIANLMTDPNAMVQVSAAGAVLRLERHIANAR